jgi:hypothetical protein
VRLGSCCDENEDDSLLAYSFLQSRWSRPTFQRCVLPPSSGRSLRHTHFWNVGLLRDYTVLCPRRLSHSNNKTHLAGDRPIVRPKPMKDIDYRKTSTYIQAPNRTWIRHPSGRRAQTSRRLRGNDCHRPTRFSIYVFTTPIVSIYEAWVNKTWQFFVCTLFYDTLSVIQRRIKGRYVHELEKIWKEAVVV